MDNLKKANEYLKAHLHEVKKDFLPTYHAHSPLNWANDPNGFSYFNGEYHLFYQYHPYKNEWGPMHWGHLKSKDLLHFTNLPIALAPDEDKENHGIFSGTAIEDPNEKGTLLVYYTSHYSLNNETREETALAISIDGINFTKKGVIISTDKIPEGFSKVDFRDPKIYFEDGTYYLLMASNKNNKGAVLVYKGKERDKFEYSFSIMLENMGKQVECPDLLKFDDKYVLIYSALHEDKPATNRYAVLNLNIKEGNYHLLNDETLDYGSDFYAAQTLYDGKSYYLIAWLSSWKKKWEFIETNQGFSGVFTLPRILSLNENHLIQRPLPIFLSSLKPTDNILEIGSAFFYIEKEDKILLIDEDDTHKVSISRKNDKIIVSLTSDYDQIERQIPYTGGEIMVVLDKCSLELFLDFGITATFFHHFGSGKVRAIGKGIKFKRLASE